MRIHRARQIELLKIPIRARLEAECSKARSNELARASLGRRSRQTPLKAVRRQIAQRRESIRAGRCSRALLCQPSNWKCEQHHKPNPKP